MPAPKPESISLYRLIHQDNLEILLRRGALHAPNFTPDDGLSYKTIHNPNIQKSRNSFNIPCGPKGTCHDYVPFYFGPLAPMLLQLHTGQVKGYTDKQSHLIYLVANFQQFAAAGLNWAFSDGHGIARFTSWYASVDNLNKVDWNTVPIRY